MKFSITDLAWIAALGVLGLQSKQPAHSDDIATLASAPNAYKVHLAARPPVARGTTEFE